MTVVDTHGYNKHVLQCSPTWVVSFQAISLRGVYQAAAQPTFTIRHSTTVLQSIDPCVSCRDQHYCLDYSIRVRGLSKGSPKKRTYSWFKSNLNLDNDASGQRALERCLNSTVTRVQMYKHAYIYMDINENSFEQLNHTPQCRLFLFLGLIVNRRTVNSRWKQFFAKRTQPTSFPSVTDSSPRNNCPMAALTADSGFPQPDHGLGGRTLTADSGFPHPEHGLGGRTLTAETKEVRGSNRTFKRKQAERKLKESRFNRCKFEGNVSRMTSVLCSP